MTRKEIKLVLKETQDYLENEYGDTHYKYICEVFAEINEKLAFLDGLLTYIKNDLTDTEYEFLINEFKNYLKSRKIKNEIR